MTAVSQVEGYAVGDKGHVVWVNRWQSKKGERMFYLCEMDRPGKMPFTLFLRRRGGVGRVKLTRRPVRPSGRKSQACPRARPRQGPSRPIR